MKKKRYFSRLAAAILTVAMLTGIGMTSLAAGITATSTTSAIQIDYKNVPFEAYNIAGNNYFKLRDIAMSLMGTQKGFSVQWDEQQKSIYLYTTGYYIPQGNELSVSGSAKSVPAVQTTAKVYLNGKQIPLTAYNIAGYNYFKLRDIGAWVDFSVLFDETANTIKINTANGYYFDNILSILTGASCSESAGKLFYAKLDSGNITVTRNSGTYYSVIAENISSTSDYIKLQNTVGVFVSSPEQVIAALKASRTEGKKTLQLDGKTVTCVAVAQTQTVDIAW